MNLDLSFTCSHWADRYYPKPIKNKEHHTHFKVLKKEHLGWKHKVYQENYIMIKWILYFLSVWKTVLFPQTQIHKLYFAVYVTAIFHFRGYLKSTWNSIHNPFYSGNGICIKYISEYTKINWLQGKKLQFCTRIAITGLPPGLILLYIWKKTIKHLIFIIICTDK